MSAVVEMFGRSRTDGEGVDSEGAARCESAFAVFRLIYSRCRVLHSVLVYELAHQGEDVDAERAARSVLLRI